MKTYFLILLSLLVTNIYGQNLSLDWAKSAGSTAANAFSYNQKGNAIAVDNLGNVYTTGEYSDIVDFDPGVGVSNLTSQGPINMFIQKLDVAGNFLWAKSIGGTSSTVSFAMTLDALGSIYTTGYYMGTVDFDPGIGISNLTSNGDRDIFIQKLDAAGNFLWAKSMGGTAMDLGAAIKVDALNNVYLTGTYSNTADFDPGVAVSNLTSNGQADIFIQKLDAAGNFLWARSTGGTGFDGTRTLAVDDLGNVYATGSYRNTVDFDPGIGISNFTSNGGTDFFIQKLDALGTFVLAKSMGGTGSEEGRSITLDPSGNIYLTGSYENMVDFDPGTGVSNLTSNGVSDIFAQKLDALGNLFWVSSMGGVSLDMGVEIVVDSFGNSYITSEYNSTVDFDPSIGVSNLTSNGSIDIALQKLDFFGNLIWVKSIGGPSFELIGAMVIDSIGNLYTTGSFGATVDFDPGFGVSNLATNGGIDFFVQKLILCTETTGTDTLTACGSYTWIDGNTYTANNNTAMDTIANAAGCDSIITLNLTILNTTSTDLQIACDNYTWIDGNTYTASNSTATDTLTNAAGCDSIVTLNLTILNSSSSSDQQIACDSYTWIDGNTYTASNSTATDTLTNAAGCDSILTLNLIILSIDTSVVLVGSTLNSNATGVFFQWIDCSNLMPISGATNSSFSPIQNGTYAVILTSNTIGSTCIDTSSCISVTMLNTRHIKTTANYSIYPNPTSTVLFLERPSNKEIEINLVNTLGQVLYTRVSISSKQQIPVEDLEVGIYYLVIKSGHEVISTPFTKVR